MSPGGLAYLGPGLIPDQGTDPATEGFTLGAGPNSRWEGCVRKVSGLKPLLNQICGTADLLNRKQLKVETRTF